MDFEQATTSAEGQKDRQRINVLFLCDEWNSSKGGLSTFNREFAVNLAKTSSDSIMVHCYVCQSNDSDRKDARRQGVNLITAQSIPGSSDVSLDCLKFPPPELPHPDIVIGHGRKFGTPAYFIVRNTNCKWTQFVHVFCEDLGKHKKPKQSREDVDTIQENEYKHKSEIDLCKAADAVVGVGYRLQSKYQRCLPDMKVQVLTPGIFESFSNQPGLSECYSDEHSLEEEFSVFVSGRVTFEDLSVKGFDIIAKAVASLGEKFKLTCVGAPPGKQRKMEEWFLKKTKITRDQLTIRGYCDQEELKGMFREAHLIALPSRAEGFGLVALEAISAGIPVLISRQSGISKALQKVEDGDSFIVASQEPVEWARRIKELSLQTPQERSDNAIRLRENYRKVYPWNTECEKFKRMIENLLEAEGGANKVKIDRLSQKVQNSPERVNIHENGKQPLSATERTDAAVLQRQVWYHLGQLFGFHTPIESHGLKWPDDVSLEEDPATGNERLVLKFAIAPSDFASRNAAPCANKACQAFMRLAQDTVIRRASIQDILNGDERLPFTSRTAWLVIQAKCADLQHTHAHLQQGTCDPSKKPTNIQDVTGYLNVATITKDGLLVVKHDEPLVSNQECIIVPRQALEGLLTALHIQLSHPCSHQLKAVTKRYLYALDMDKAIDHVSQACYHCAALRQTPKVQVEQSSCSQRMPLAYHSFSDDED